VLLAAMVASFASNAALIARWETTWREAVNPVRSQVYSARIGHSHCLLRSWWWWQSASGFFWNANSLEKNEHKICIGNYRPDLIACGLQQTEERVRRPQ
jgi:hypothetical protein